MIAAGAAGGSQEGPSGGRLSGWRPTVPKGSPGAGAVVRCARWPRLQAAPIAGAPAFAPAVLAAPMPEDSPGGRLVGCRALITALRTIEIASRPAEACSSKPQSSPARLRPSGPSSATKAWQHIWTGTAAGAGPPRRPGAPAKVGGSGGASAGPLVAEQQERHNTWAMQAPGPGQPAAAGTGSAASAPPHPAAAQPPLALLPVHGAPPPPLLLLLLLHSAAAV